MSATSISYDIKYAMNASEGRVNLVIKETNER